MRSKFTLLLLALNLALFGYLLLSERPWSATRGIDENRRRVLGPEAADLARIEITTLPPADATDTPPAAPLANTLALERRADGAWQLTSPLDWPANDFAVRRILNELQFLEHETSFLVSDLSRNGQTLADYGLDQPSIIVTGTPATQPTRQSMIDNSASPSASPPPPPFTLKIGATAAVGGRLYVLSPDAKRIHVVSPSLAAALSLDLAQLRSDQLFTIPVFEARALTLQTAAANAARTRLRREENRWLFEAPINARAAKTPVELAVNDLNSLRVARFFSAGSAPSPETTGLASPRLRVTLEGNARRETLVLGAPAPSAEADPDTVELYARLEWRSAPAALADRDHPVLFTVRLPSRLLSSLEQAQTALRDRRVLDLDPSRVTALAASSPAGRLPELRIQKLDTDEAWQISAPAPAAPLRADPLLVARLLQRLQLLEAVPPRPDASPFVSDAPSAADLERLGFNLPQRVVTLQLASSAATSAGGPSSAGQEIVLELAQPVVAGPELYARVAGQPFVYALPPETLDQIPLAPRFYRDRSLLRLPASTAITRLVLRRADAPDSPPLLDYSPQVAGLNPPPSAATPQVAGPNPPPSVATLLAALRQLRAQTIVREDFPPTVLVDGVEKPWAYELEATLEPPLPSGPLRLLLAERGAGSTQLAGSSDLGLVFTLEQPVLDALWALLQQAPKP